MSSLSVNAAQTKSVESDWSRLIPGWAPDPARGSRQLSGSGRPFVVESPNEGKDILQSPKGQFWRFFLPGPLQSRTAHLWLRWVTADFALVTLNWFLLGAMFVTLHAIFPRVRIFGYGAGTPLSLVGLGILQGAFITLLGHAEGQRSQSLDRDKQGAILAKSVLWATVLLCLPSALQGAPWTVILLFACMAVPHYCALRVWALRSESRERTAATVRNVLVVGAGDVGRRIARDLEENADVAGRKFRGFLDDEPLLGSGVIGRISDLGRMARQEFVDEVILAAPRDGNTTSRILEEAQRLHLDVEIVPELFGCKPVEHETEQVGNLPMICLHEERLPALGLVLKRMLDVVGATLFLAALSPFLPIAAALIKLDSDGPLFYRALRAGRKGQAFRCYKLRTMFSDADELKAQLRERNERSRAIFKIAGDPRISRIGHYLRRYSIDELPQLWNVLRGEMSLVGPRPHPLDDVAGYEIEHLARLDMTPGMTGLWQVTARCDPSFERGVELDREYIRTWSLFLDFQILFKTISAVVQGSGQ